MVRVSEMFRRYHRVFLGILILVGIYFTSFYGYLLFHSLAELFSIVIAFGIFIAPLFINRKLRSNPPFLIYAVCVALLFGMIFYRPIFPDCFIEGKGLIPL